MSGEKKGKFSVPKVLFLLLMILGVGIYVATTILAMQYDDKSFSAAATDIGRYSFTILLFFFGLLGYLLFRAREKESELED